MYARRFKADGTPLESEFLFNNYTTDDQASPALAMEANGDFVVTWESSNQDGDVWGIYAQRFDRTGNPVGFELQVNTQTLNDQLHPGRLPWTATAASWWHG